jgi:hypothetical protein
MTGQAKSGAHDIATGAEKQRQEARCARASERYEGFVRITGWFGSEVAGS